jgi:hypothetical protein
MKLQDSYNEIIAEQIAQVYLSRTGLVTVSKTLDFEADLIASRKDKPEERIIVEVKATTVDENQIPVKYKDTISKFERKMNLQPSLIFFINSEKKTGYFQIFSSKNQKKLHRLRMDLLSFELSQYFSSPGGMEFPPYSFYQRDDEAKYSTREIPVDPKFAILRLYNLTFPQMDKKDEFKINVTVQEAGEPKPNPTTFLFRKLFYNPNLKDFLFFVNESTGTEYTDIPLPKGQKFVTFKIESTANINFEIKLACEYIIGGPDYRQ